MTLVSLGTLVGLTVTHGVAMGLCGGLEVDEVISQPRLNIDYALNQDGIAHTKRQYPQTDQQLDL